MTLTPTIATPETVVRRNTPLPAPDPHLHDLDWFLGAWDIESRLLKDAATETWVSDTQYAEHTAVLGGHVIFEHFFGPMDGEPFEAWSLRKYNPQSGKWEQRWVDTSSPGFLNWTGSYADGKYTGYAARYIDEDGNLTGEQGTREIFDQITPERFHWRLESTRDGGQTWRVIWTLVYTRR